MPETFKTIKASEFFKLIDNDSIKETYDHIKDNNIVLKPSTKYSLLVNDDPFPPKDFIRIIAKLKGYSIDESTLYGGKANKPFEKLGYTIDNSKKTSKENLKIEFAKWLLKNGAESYRQYYGNSLEEIEIKLDEINSFFPTRDLFSVVHGNYEELKSFLTKNIYGENRKKNTAFFDYDELKGNGRPKAVLGRSNYFIFLDGKMKKDKVNTIDKQLLRTYWAKYKDYFRLPDSEHTEKYKWSVLKQVYSNWDWDAENKPQMFKDAFNVSGPKNLWLSGNFYPIEHTNWMFQNFRSETENAISTLLNEGLPLIDRINNFINFYDTKLPELQELIPDKKIKYHSHNDLRAIALYLTLQHPKKYFLFKYGMVKKFYQKMELPTIKAGNKENLGTYLDISNQVLEFIKEDIEFSDEYKEFTEKDNNYDDDSLHLLTQDFIYTVANHFNDKIKYWRIGSNDGDHSYSKEMLSDDYIALGWNDIGDLAAQKIKTKEEVSELLTKHKQTFGSEGVKTRKAGEIFDFYLNANKNDIVTLMNGNSVIAIGKIIDNYKYNKNYPFAHSRSIIWLKKDVKNFTLNDGIRTTFYPLTKKETKDKINKFLIPSNGDDFSNGDDLKTNSMDLKKHSLNQILYGPPGTGKTYKTKKIAVEIIENKEYSDSLDDREIILAKYDTYVNSGNIHFTTFHQSLSYEDFIEGIKPETSDNQVIYDVKDGIFKEICNKAKVKQESNFEDAYQSLLNEISEITDDYLLLKTPRKKEFRININSNNNLNLYTSKDIKKQGTLTKDKLLKQINGFDVFDGWGGYASSIIEYLKTKHHLTTKIKDKKKGNYVLVIDEINRGNVSAIFGELITLIETDKRLGEKESISVTLPYSKSLFSVPNNVYIVGTMNTADRSVEALDTALRRRFSFEEVLPKPELLNELNYQEVNLELLLDRINQRIELLVDKDHQIGHSYFFNINTLEDLKLVFKDSIIPLLEEYFYGDFGKIGLVLGERFVEQQAIKNKTILAPFKAYDEIDFVTDKKIFRIKPIDNMEDSDFISIYNN
ncbi:AAA family ATPase [Lacinutrix sp. MEBiC02595]